MKNFTKIILSILLVCVMLFPLAACNTNNDNNDALLDQIASLQQQLAELQSKYDDLANTDELDQLLQQIAELQDKCNDLANSDEVDQLQQQLAELQGRYDDLVNSNDELNSKIDYVNIGSQIATISYEKVKYIDANLRDRDCINGENYAAAQQWIQSLALGAGYSQDDVTLQDFNFSRRGTQYTSQNIVVTKVGQHDGQIIVGAHYDGTGTGDNGSGVALALTVAEALAHVDTYYTIQFVFFSAEEYGCYGSTAYANSLTDEEVANTLYMINLDSLVCGDYCYLYGGVQDDDNQVVTDTEAYDNAMYVANLLGLNFHSNPWTWENPAPGYDTPDYASPSTGDWSDHVGFKKRGIKYLYMEATNWEIPGPYNEYDGYGETILVGMLMNTENDYLEYIEHYFPGRIQHHLTQFGTLLYALLTQPNVNF